jgi:hypothetical protein
VAHSWPARKTQTHFHNLAPLDEEVTLRRTTLKIIQETTAPRPLSAPPHVSPPFSSATTGVVASAHVESQLAVTITEGAIVGAMAGLDIVTSKLDSVRIELESGALVRILSDWDFGSLGVNALFVNGSTIKPATRVHGFAHQDFDTDFTEHSWRLWT